MSYAEFSEGDVYLQDTPEGGWLCNGCKLAPLVNTSLYGELFKVHDNVRLTNLDDVEDHIYDHIKKNHIVPKRCLKRIEQELEEQRSQVGAE